jgi:hypothetical protein
VNEGNPVVLSHKRSEAAKAFHALAAIYSSAGTPAEDKPPKRSLLGRRNS